MKLQKSLLALFLSIQFIVLAFADAPDWSFNLNDYETNSGVTAIVSIDNVVQEGSDGLLIAFAPDGSVRGVSSPSGPLPFGPYAGWLKL